jgi:low affinity Fe/Cu permease
MSWQLIVIIAVCGVVAVALVLLNNRANRVVRGCFKDAQKDLDDALEWYAATDDQLRSMTRKQYKDLRDKTVRSLVRIEDLEDSTRQKLRTLFIRLVKAGEGKQ